MLLIYGLFNNTNVSSVGYLYKYIDQTMELFVNETPWP
jgi:hypothetical protein